MNLVLSLLLLAADTGGVPAVTGVARDGTAAFRTVSIYGESAINCDTPRILSPDGWLGADKFQHAAMSYVITAGTAAAARTIADRDDSLLIGAAIGAAAGIAKEIYDRKSSMRDVVWNVAGIAAGVLITRNAR